MNTRHRGHPLAPATDFDGSLVSAPAWLQVHARTPFPPGWYWLVSRHIDHVATHLLPPEQQEGVVVLRAHRGTLDADWIFAQRLPAGTLSAIEYEARALSESASGHCAHCGCVIPRDRAMSAVRAMSLPDCGEHPAQAQGAPPTNAADAALPANGDVTAFFSNEDMAASLAVVDQAENAKATGDAESATRAQPGLPLHRLYDVDAVKAIGERLLASTTDHEGQVRIRQATKRLVGAGGERPWAYPRDKRSLCAELLERFPNFAEVIGCAIRPALQLALINGKLSMPPLMLEGPPAIGKSALAHSLAQMFGTPYLRIDMAVEQSNATLVGSSTFWSNCQPGLLFPILAFGSGDGRQRATANPVVVIDEVEKASADKYDPLSPLYTLLEPETAANFEDLSLPGIRFDASQVLWILTANRGDQLPEPILSRVQRFEIRPHTRDELRTIARRMMADMLVKHAPEAELSVDDDVYERLAARSPRQMRIAIFAALGEAAGRGMDRLGVDDLPPLGASAAVPMRFV